VNLSDDQSTPQGTAIHFPPLRHAWYAMAVFIIVATMAFIDKSIIVLLVGPIKASLGVSDTGISLLQGFSFVMLYSVLGIPSGYLVDRYRRRELLAAGIALWSVMTVLCGMTSTFAGLFMARIGVGVGEAILMPAVFSLLADFFAPGQRGRANGVFTISTYAGGQGALIIGGMVLKAFHQNDFVWPVLGRIEQWKSAFIAVGIPGLLVALLVLTIKEPARQRSLGRQDKLADGADAPVPLVAYLRTRKTLWLGVFGAFSLFAFAAFTMFSWLPTFFIRKFGLPASSAGMMIGSVILPGGIVGCLVSGTLSDYWKKRRTYGSRMRVVLVAALLTIPCVALLPFTPTPTLAMILCGVFGFSSALATASMPSVLQDIAGNRMRGKITAIHLLLVSIFGMGFGSMAPAMVTDLVFHNEKGLIYAIAITSLPALLACVFVTWKCMGLYARAEEAARIGQEPQPAAGPRAVA